MKYITNDEPLEMKHFPSSLTKDPFTCSDICFMLIISLKIW